MFRFVFLLWSTSSMALLAQTEAGWSARVEVKKGKETAVTYRAQVMGDVLLVEAMHGEGWHTYTLDNAARAKKRAGTPALGIEKSTELRVTGLRLNGKWRQSKPKDLSQPEIEWFTWGFEDKVYFGAPLDPRSLGQAVITINAQACKASLCANVDGAELRVTRASGVNSARPLVWSSLIEAGDLSQVASKR
jgi:hypothetical protein